jgi:hypothetical protein
MGLKFSEAWARRLNNDVGDHVATRQTHRRFWQRVCGSIERRLSLVSFFGENLAAAAFGTFATLSAQNRHADAVAARLLLGDERTWLGRGSKSENDPERTSPQGRHEALGRAVPRRLGMTERVSLTSISPIRAAQHLGLGACCAGHGAAHSRTKTSVAAIGSTHPVHPVAGIMQSFALGTVTICCAARVRYGTLETCRWTLKMSAYRGGPEVVGTRLSRRVCRVGPGNFTPSPSQNRT